MLKGTQIPSREFHLQLIGIPDQNPFLLLDLYDGRIDGLPYEIDSVLAVLLAAITLATDRNCFLVICS